MNDSASRRAPDLSKLLAEWIGRRYAGHIILLAVTVGMIGVGWMNPLGQVPTNVDIGELTGMGAALPTTIPVVGFVAAAPPGAASDDLTRLTELHTYIPDRPRLEIISYTVQPGDSVLGIAEKFGITPETVVFSNPILNNNPHFMEPGQTLRIAPVSGLIRDVITGDTLGGLARVYGVKPEDIINWPSNKIDSDNPQITAGQMLFVPGGNIGTITISQPPTGTGTTSGSTGSSGGSGGGGAGSQRKEPWVLQSGPGACAGGLSGGVAGSGTFIWPASHHWVSGYDFSGIHTGIDVDGDVGEPAYASDSGVVVFAGWSEWGYGNTVVVAHGNSWWTLYAHLSAINVGCGQGVYQGNQIGAIGSTGKSQGAHLHFEVYYGVFPTNPWGVLPPP